LLVVGTVLVAAFFALRAFRWASRSLHPVRVAVVKPVLTGSLVGLRDVSFVTSDGLTIRGWYVPSKNRAAVVLTQALGQNRMEMLFEARCLADRGFGALLFDSRAQGASDGDLVTWGDREVRDLRAAVDFVAAQKDVDRNRIGALGCSMGGFALADLAATDTRIKAVAVSAMNTSLEDVIRYDYRRWGWVGGDAALFAFRHGGVNVDAVRPIDAVGRISPRPVLFLNGKHDPDSPHEAQERLWDAARAPKSRWDVEGAEYGNYEAVDPEGYKRALVGFFEGSLVSSRR